MTYYTKLEDMLRHAEIGDIIRTSEDSFGKIVLLSEPIRDVKTSGYNVHVNGSHYGDTFSYEKIEDLIKTYYEIWGDGIELIKKWKWHE